MKVGIIGLGLMGGSFGRTLVRLGHEVYGKDISEETLFKAEMIKAISDRLDIINAKELDVLVVAVNPSVFKSALSEFLPSLKDGCCVIDFCGTKERTTSEMQELSKLYPNLDFIGGHPMAGREFSGIDHATATLFNKASMIFVPVKADIFALDKWKKFFLSVGFAEVVVTTAENHDRMIAFTSQLCHVVSNAFIKSPTAKEHFGYSAGSYKDMTRVARLSPEMWAELMIDDREYLSFELDTFIDSLQKYSSALKSGDKQALKELLKEGNDRKLSIDLKGGNKNV